MLIIDSYVALVKFIAFMFRIVFFWVFLFNIFLVGKEFIGLRESVFSLFIEYVLEN